MRLISTRTLELVEFFSSEIPSYAILSHCWGKNEVSLQQFNNGEKRDTPAFKKIIDCCRLAREHGLDWAWIDCCCIDRTSSTELSEAINSMFRWYEQAKVCFAFLSDLELRDNTYDFSTCRWFSRGWTLQELLAPPEVRFFDKFLKRVGSRRSLAYDIASAAEIDSRYLLQPRSFREACVAQRMSWAAGRRTSRTEDIAYCLLGLFDVNMPLLYGEGGRKAFLRLQQYIISQSSDESIFAWMSHDGPERRGMLAKWPSEFARCGDVRRSGSTIKRPPYTVTSRGLEFPIAAAFAPDWLTPVLPQSFGSPMVQIDCEQGRLPAPTRSISIRLKRAPDGHQIWYRADASKLELRNKSMLWETLDVLIHGYTTVYIPQPEFEDGQPGLYKPERHWLGDMALTNLVPSVLWMMCLPLSFTSMRLLPECDCCQNSRGIMLWVYLAWGWKLSRNSYWYLVSVIAVLWLFGDLHAYGLLVAALSRTAFIEVARFVISPRTFEAR